MQPPDHRNTGPAGTPQGPGNDQGRRPSWFRRNLIWIALLAVIPWVIFLVWGPNSGSAGAMPVSYSQFISQVQDNNVASVTLSDNGVVGTYKHAIHSDLNNSTGTKFTTTIPNLNSEDTVPILRQHNVQIITKDTNGGAFWFTLLIQFVPVLLLIGGIYFLSRRASAAQGNLFSFGQSRARMYMGGKTKTTFADVAGVDEAKADLPFFSMSGSEFVEMLVGVGASRVRDLFERAKKAAPCIIFIDELDAVGRQRGAGLGGGNDEREQTLNQILVEMDGFDPRQAIIVIAATNRPDVLDPALMRPGRFDRQVVVDRPDRPGREAILQVHTRGMPLANDVDLSILARGTPGMVGADLANICNEAALLAARRNKNLITMHDFEDAIDRIMMGAQRPLLLSPEERQVIAYHEGGHALVALLTPGADAVRKVTIVPRGQALGVTQIMPIDDRHNYPRGYLLNRISVGLGGRVAEQVALGEITTGAENDFQNVTNLAREMVTRWGMSGRIGTVFFGHDRDVFLGREMSLGSQRDYSEETASAIDEEVHRIIAERYAYVERVLTRYRPLLDEIAKRLLEKEVVEEAELRAIVADVPAADVLTLAEGLEASPRYDKVLADGAVAANGNGAGAVANAGSTAGGSVGATATASPPQ